MSDLTKPFYVYLYRKKKNDFKLFFFIVTEPGNDVNKYNLL